MTDHCRFAPAARYLCAVAARVLGWRPGEFWSATPAELAACLADPAAPATTPLTRTDFDRLINLDRDGGPMDAVDELLVEVRASTQGFTQDIARMRGAFDGTLVDGFARASTVLERGLLGAIRSGGLGFDDLKRTARATFDQIAASALHMGLDKLFGGGGGGGLSGLVGGALGSLFGLPGRATGGPVSPGQGFLVGERGPELFVPTSAGRIEANFAGGKAREVRVAINLTTPRGASAPVAMQRSSRQVASAVRRALVEY